MTTLCYRIGTIVDLGFACPNGDLIQALVNLVRHRTAALHLHWVRGHAGDKHNEAADQLAKLGARGAHLPWLPSEFDIPDTWMMVDEEDPCGT